MRGGTSFCRREAPHKPLCGWSACIDPSRNVLLHCSRCNRGTRTGSRVQKDGVKERFCKKCGTSLGQLSPAQKK